MSIRHCLRGIHIDQLASGQWWQLVDGGDKKMFDNLAGDTHTSYSGDTHTHHTHWQPCRRYSYSPDSAVEDSARPSMSSTLPLPRSWSSSLPSCQLSVWWFSCYDSYQLSDGFHSSGPDRAPLPMKTTVGTRFTFINMIISIIYHNPHIGVQKVSTPIELRELHYIDRLLATSTSHPRYRPFSFIVRFHLISVIRNQ